MNDDDRQLDLWNLLAIYFETPERLEDCGADAVARVLEHVERCEYCRALRDRGGLAARPHPHRTPED